MSRKPISVLIIANTMQGGRGCPLLGRYCTVLILAKYYGNVPFVVMVVIIHIWGQMRIIFL
jgi:hypothetical protein